MLDRPAAVLVLGMHRSGTSALTRLVHLLGVPVGPEERLMGAEPSNRHGHWESLPLVAVDDDLLAAVGARWSGPPAAGVGPDVEADLVERGRRAWSSLFGDGAGVWKDPRLCLTLPFWRAVLPADLVGLLCLRHPAEVAASLAARDGFGLDYALALWERYTRLAVVGAAGLPVHVVPYEDLIARPQEAGEAVARFLEARTPLVDEASRDAAWASIDPGDRHHQDHDLSALTDEQRSLLEVLADLRGPHDAFPDVELPPETPGLDLAFAEHVRMSRWADEAQQLQDGLREQAEANEEHVAHLHADLEARSAEASRLAEDVMAARAQVEELQAALDHVRSRRSYRALQAVRRLTGPR